MTVCFTGHRQINGVYAPNGEWGAVLTKVTEVITLLHYKYGHTDFISGGALGFDQTAACAVLNLKADAGLPIRLILALPFQGFDSKWIYESKVLFKLMCAAADHVNYICDPGYAAWKMMKRNEWMVDNAKTVVALYLGEGKTGGTLNCINYTMKQKKPLITIHPLTRVVSGVVYDTTTNSYREEVI